MIEADPWAQWILERRHGADAEFAARLAGRIDAMRDRVLDAANLRPGMTLADVGCGDGLVGLGAIARVGSDLTVYFADPSPTLLKAAVEAAGARDVLAQCHFVHARAEAMPMIPSASLDVVTARSVLAYVPDKIVALREFARVLKPGGRLSIADPIFQDQALLLAAVRDGLSRCAFGADGEDVEMLHRWRSAQLPDTAQAIEADPLTCFNERDLLRYAQRAGFTNLHLDLHVAIEPALPIPWTTLLASAPIPGAPTLAEVLATKFSDAERTRFEERFRASYEAGTPVEQTSIAYLTATKPA